MAARLTPDQKVGSSNLSALNLFDWLSSKKRSPLSVLPREKLQCGAVSSKPAICVVAYSRQLPPNTSPTHAMCEDFKPCNGFVVGFS